MTGSRRMRSDAERNRKHLVEVAQRVLSAEPRASMAAIADAAGLGRNTIHRHFPSRQDLLDAVRLHASAAAAANEVDELRPAGELGSAVPARLLVSEVLNKVPPFRVGEQIVAEAQRLPGVLSAAIYLPDLDGLELRKLAGADTFPSALTIDVAVGRELPREAIDEVRESIAQALPNVVVAPMLLRSRATGVLLALGSCAAEDLRELAGAAAPALALAEDYTDRNDRVARSRPTDATAELQQNLLPPRIVRVSGAMVAGNVVPGYEFGGDWFDYADNPEGTWIGIADTTRSGARSTAVASLALGAFRAERHLDAATPATAIAAMHAVVRELSELQVPVAATIARWHGASGLLEWVACGAQRPVLIENDGSAREIGALHPPLGDPAMPITLHVESRQLWPGERVVFASDGLMLRADPEGEQFGVAGVGRTAGALGERTAAATVRAITRAAFDHLSGTPFQDDATIVVLAANPRVIAD